jgi:transposase
VTPSPEPRRFLGCDVGKSQVVVFDSLTAQIRTLPNTPEALTAWARTLDEACLIVCESTGGHEAALLQAALVAERPAHRADARKVKAFIRSYGTLGKSDTIDARALARYGAERQASLHRWRAPDASRARLQQLLLARRDLIAQRQACTNRLQAVGAEAIAQYLEPVVARIADSIRALDEAIARIIRETAALKEAAQALVTIKGIGPTTAAALLGLMPEIGLVGRKQAAALAGLAPHPNQSGTADRYRPIRGGRPELRRALFMAALVAARHNPQLRDFHQRLREAGKKPIVAVTAVMRKLIVIANATVRDKSSLKVS